MGILDILKGIGSGASRLPRIIGDKLNPYETYPIMAPETIGGGPIMVNRPRTPMDEIPSPEVADYGTQEADLAAAQAQPGSSLPDQIDVGGEPMPTGGLKKIGERRVLNPAKAKILGDMLRSATAAVATPNIAGGGPVDIARAMQAGQAAPVNRDILAEKMRQEQLKQAADIEHVQAQAEQARAQAEDYRQQTALRVAQTAQVGKLKPKDDVIAVKDGLYNLTTSQWVSKPTEKPEPADDALLREFADPNTTEPRRKLIKSAMEMRYGHGDTGHTTEGDIVWEAANGNPIAQKAWSMLQSKRDAGDRADERQKHAAIVTGWNRYSTELSQAEQQFAAQKATLDKVKPEYKLDAQGKQIIGTDGKPQLVYKPGGSISDQEYNDRLTNLESELQTKKNNTQNMIESTLAEFDVPFSHQQYPHPSTQRRAGTGTTAAPQQREVPELPPEISAKIQEGETARIAVPGNKIEFWKREHGVLKKVAGF